MGENTFDPHIHLYKL